MKMYVKDGVVKTPKDIEIVKSIRNEIEVEDFVPIEGELDENGDQKFETVIKTVVQEKEVKVYNPTEEDILADGWEVYVPEPAEPYDATKGMEYAELVNYYIRERYSESDEFAILRQRDTKNDEWEEYFAYCEECKKRAKQIKEDEG